MDPILNHEFERRYLRWITHDYSTLVLIHSTYIFCTVLRDVMPLDETQHSRMIQMDFFPPMDP